MEQEKNTKSVLYITNIEVPYRVRFFNELAKQCNLTVLYEREKSSNRDVKWALSEHKQYKTEYLNGRNIGRENAFSINIFHYPFKNYDIIVLGCFNSPYQIFLMCYFRMFGIKYILNLDGEIFLHSNSLKGKLKRFFLWGAKSYLTAGVSSARSIKAVIPKAKITPYYFSSLDEEDICIHASKIKKQENNRILVIGQYFDYKGLDIVVEAVKQISDVHCTIVGTGNRTEEFLEAISNAENIRVIPFLQRNDLEKLYLSSTMLVLPSRQECWGLVINEAASFGLPIVSTWGSGAAVEFLADTYPEFLAIPADIEDLKNKILALLELWGTKEFDKYSQFLVKRAQNYTIERMVEKHIEVFNDIKHS